MFADTPQMARIPEFQQVTFICTAWTFHLSRELLVNSEPASPASNAKAAHNLGGVPLVGGVTLQCLNRHAAITI